MLDRTILHTIAGGFQARMNTHHPELYLSITIPTMTCVETGEVTDGLLLMAGKRFDVGGQGIFACQRLATPEIITLEPINLCPHVQSGSLSLQYPGDFGKGVVDYLMFLYCMRAALNLPRLH